MAMVVGSRRRRRLQAGLVYTALIALAAVFLFPLLWVFGLSLKTRLQVFADPPLFIWWPTFENYLDVLGRSDFLLAFVNTLVVAGSAVALSLCVGVPAAYAFARFPFTGRSFLFFALLVMRMLPPIAVLVPMYVLFSKLGLATTRLSVVLAYSSSACRWWCGSCAASSRTCQRNSRRALGSNEGVTDVICLMGFYTSVSMTLAFYDVPAGAEGMAR